MTHIHHRPPQTIRAMELNGRTWVPAEDVNTLLAELSTAKEVIEDYQAILKVSLGRFRGHAMPDGGIATFLAKHKDAVTRLLGEE